ncbi:Protein CBG18902 [Caenorhabditis briggsae]|uniref:Uncharacterized protein n=3 Tax=Caenorhabditis TaxID=6237 RepID=A0AAE9F794_CAEBR|nr:Protein CBG18902 [Caenorhabditis briggsae]PIC27617.1 hypothetical protein B9Z55_019815 [Caenorhabditis nigoni]ULT90206.1 hypothetical protein L3Y34_008516 [Caenorhabditis briggsae]UMM36011.1 hypothetical protein L5515_008361 [Caenorhabditis briggsae]CAP36242.1 Protein CBG18902 [Caenorhabditis briggsae]
MTTDKVCGCNVVTSAGVVTSLQLIVLLLTLSSTGLILDRYRTWQTSYPQTQYNATAQAAANGTLKFNATIWSETWVELGMAWYVGFGAFWLFSILILVLSFKYYRPVFVVPNFTALVVGIFMNLLAFGVLLARILTVSKDYRTDEYQEVIIIYVMGLCLFACICCLLFIIFISKYHTFLRNRYGHQVPKFIQSRARTGYHDEAY